MAVYTSTARSTKTTSAKSNAKKKANTAKETTKKTCSTVKNGYNEKKSSASKATGSSNKATASTTTKSGKATKAQAASVTTGKNVKATVVKTEKASSTGAAAKTTGTSKTASSGSNGTLKKIQEIRGSSNKTAVTVAQKNADSRISQKKEHQQATIKVQEETKSRQEENAVVSQNSKRQKQEQSASKGVTSTQINAESRTSIKKGHQQETKKKQQEEDAKNPEKAAERNSKEIHTVLDAAGMIEVFGTGADLVNAALYAAEGDKAGTAASLLSVLPLAGLAFGAAKMTKNAMGEVAEELVEGAVNTTSRVVKKGGLEAVEESVEAAIKGGGDTIITPEMEEKILLGQRKNPAKNELIGGHSPDINNSNPNYAVEVLQVNPDGTQKVKFVTQYADGNLSNIKTSTLFPEGWSSDKIINSIKTVGDSTPIGVRASDGAMLYRDIIDGVQIEVIKIGDTVTSGYPTGGIKTGLLPGFSTLE